MSEELVEQTAAAVRRFAEELDGRCYLEELEGDDIVRLSSSGLAVVFSRAEATFIRGAIEEDSLSDIIHLEKRGHCWRIPKNECSNSDCPHFVKSMQESPKIEVLWSNKHNALCYHIPWHHATFKIYDGGPDGIHVCCIGAVFHVSQIGAGS